MKRTIRHSAQSPLDEGLHDSSLERSSCGFGLMARTNNQADHRLVETALLGLERLSHRGAIGADGKTGDGCGILLLRPHDFLRAVAKEAKLSLAKNFASGLIFLHQEEKRAEHAKKVLQSKLEAQGMVVAGWRRPPTQSDCCGARSYASMPRILQIFINAPADWKEERFERALFFARCQSEQALSDDRMFFPVSLSSRHLIYKGLLLAPFLADFYPDLRDPRLSSKLCIFHQRFSTNTLPQWRMAQPFSMLAHNGEINTIRGNRNWANARCQQLARKHAEWASLLPLIQDGESDSYSLNKILEFLLAGGLDAFQAMRLLVPPAWQNNPLIDSDRRSWLEYGSLSMEPWDGPAALAFSDGNHACCTLDRNGLRPARWVLTRDQQLTIASEIGVYDYAPQDILAKGKLKPGQIMALEMHSGRLLRSETIDQQLSGRRPYQQWLQHAIVDLAPSTQAITPPPQETLQRIKRWFLVSNEEQREVLDVLGSNGQEAIVSMGDDAPLGVFSQQAHSLYDYFRQCFAQVTNPPIDSLREDIVMSLHSYLGAKTFRFHDKHSPPPGKWLRLPSPLLDSGQYQSLATGKVFSATHPAYQIALHHPLEKGLQAALEELAEQAVEAVHKGAVLLLLDDQQKDGCKGFPIPALLACGAIHHRLSNAGLRSSVNLIVATASARDPHHIACLIGQGATAVYPYLAYWLIDDTAKRHAIPQQQAISNYQRGINKGLLKILSKMGISTITGYRGAQLFEIIGLHKEVVKLCFPGSLSRIGGANFADLEQEVRALCASEKDHPSVIGGKLRYIHNGEYHAFNPDVVTLLQRAVVSGDNDDYRRYADSVNNRPAAMLRDWLHLRPATKALPLEQVEPAAAILRRFDSAGMSLGALSPEAHETLAIAMNQLGGRSNSGEGGEDPRRYNSEKNSAIKQIASGRFGVTPHYLVHADVLQIKMAQGAKPGEGGQLIKNKIDQRIAKLRYSIPGVSLISPPPHHDIYSIEDLKQLIFDLKQVNPQALVSVKLVATAGVGTIAAGVVKAAADLITISGYDGGTGASPLTSVKYAGSPWEMGLAETHQVLQQQGLRDQVILQTDGGLKTGLDVIKAAILGAESFGFGTAPMVAMGCKYLRLCHLNNCPTGIATQHAQLREQHFKGNVERIKAYFSFVVEEVRGYLSLLGLRSLPELIGRSDLLEIINSDTGRQRHLDLSPVLNACKRQANRPYHFAAANPRPHNNDQLEERMLRDCLPAIRAGHGGMWQYQVKNYHRSIGARISGEIARRYAEGCWPGEPVQLVLRGTAGQSLGCWNADGLHLSLEGDANDYVGKGMAGGRIVVRPDRAEKSHQEGTIVVGNTCLYGATAGECFISGGAGERFAVRNSGATAVIESIGDHGCEYMTGGTVIILGSTGLNFAAGMTGGCAFVYDKEKQFSQRCNQEMVVIEALQGVLFSRYRDFLLSLVERFVAATKNRHGSALLPDIASGLAPFLLVRPKDAAHEQLLALLQPAA